MAFWDTAGVFDVDVTEVASDFLSESLANLISTEGIVDSGLGSVIVIPNIFPGGSDSICFPLSDAESRNAIASSTACCRLRAT